VPVQVVDGDEWQPARPRERLRSGDTDEQRSDQAGMGRHGYRVDVAVAERLVDHGRDQLEMPPARDLRHHAAESGMEGCLACDHTRRNFAIVRHNRCGGLVAARLDPEDHDGCPASFHMINASSLLSV
jgi:hypothetical protein